MNLLDYCVLGIFVIFILRGLYKGFISTIFSIGAFILSCAHARSISGEGISVNRIPLGGYGRGKISSLPKHGEKPVRLPCELALDTKPCLPRPQFQVVGGVAQPPVKRRP